MISVDSTTLVPYTRWKDDRPIEYFRIARYTHTTTGNPFTQLPFTASSFRSRVASRVLFHAFTRPLVDG